MKSEDLMVGDWVMNPNTGRKKKITRNNIKMGGCNIYVPIPLTEEILKKNKFKSRFVDCEDEPSTWFSTYISDSVYWEDGVLCTYDGVAICPCEYVHELQHALKLFKENKTIVL